MMPELKELDFKKRLAKLNLIDRTNRRLHGDLIQFIEIIKRFEIVNFAGGITFCQRIHFRATQPEKATFFPRNNFLVKRVVNYWNKLPEEVIIFNYEHIQEET
jgi:hypothetical protein